MRLVPTGVLAVTTTALLALAVVAAPAQDAAAKAPSVHPDLGPSLVWVGPRPFVKGRTLRPDYYSTLIHPDQWPTVLAHTDVFKSYLMILPPDPLPGQTGPQLTDAQLGRLAHFFRSRGIKVAFEVGGIRLYGDWPVSELGRLTAQTELKYLRRWLRVGGTIDYLTTDHAVMGIAGAPYMHKVPRLTAPVPLEKAIEQQVDYFAAVSRAIPGVKLGAIESLGFFEVEGPGRKIYHRTVASLPKVRFAHYLDLLLAAMKRRGLKLNHFDVDFGYSGALYDGGGKKLDYGRILGVEHYCQSHGVRCGIIFNAFHDRSVKNPDPAVASRQAHDRTLAYFRGYVAAGGKCNDWVIQTWQPYPNETGPEDKPDTVLNIARDIVDDPAFPVGVRR